LFKKPPPGGFLVFAGLLGADSDGVGRNCNLILNPIEFTGYHQPFAARSLK
jgi:hypothetical protein